MFPRGIICITGCKMSKKVINLNKQRQKKKPRSLDEALDAGEKLFLDKLPNDLKEPEALASGGDMSKILEEDDEIEDEEEK